MYDDMICPVCERGALTPRTDTMHVVYARGSECLVPVPHCEYSTCGACGADPVLAEQAKRNDVRIATARKEFDLIAT